MRYELRRYLGGAAAARAGDEMSGPALLLLGFAATRSPAAGSALLAGLTIAAAAGGPVFGAVLDRSPRPERVLAGMLAAYAAGICAIQFVMGHLGTPIVVGVALVTGLFGPAVAGGWTSQLPRVVTRDTPSREALSRGSALDALTFSVASLAGPALAAVIAAAVGPRPAVLAAAGLVALAVPVAWSLPRPAQEPGPGAHRGFIPVRQLTDGFVAILVRPALRRATATSVVSYVGIGMLLVCCPVLGQQRLGAASRGALLISAVAVASLIANGVFARHPPRVPDRLIFASTLVLCGAMAAAAVAPGWLTMLAVAAGGAGEGPQLTSLFEVRHRETPAGMRARIFTTAASLKIGGLAAGAALAGPLASRSVTTCLLVAAVTELCASAVYLATWR